MKKLHKMFEDSGHSKLVNLQNGCLGKGGKLVKYLTFDDVRVLSQDSLLTVDLQAFVLPLPVLATFMSALGRPM